MLLFSNERQRVYAMDDETNKRHPGKRKDPKAEEYNTQPEPPRSTSWAKPKPAQLGWWERIKRWSSPAYRKNQERAEAEAKAKARAEAEAEADRAKADAREQDEREQRKEQREKEDRAYWDVIK